VTYLFLLLKQRQLLPTLLFSAFASRWLNGKDFWTESKNQLARGHKLLGVVSNSTIHLARLFLISAVYI
jgi:hypothetical protein